MKKSILHITLVALLLISSVVNGLVASLVMLVVGLIQFPLSVSFFVKRSPVQKLFFVHVILSITLIVAIMLDYRIDIDDFMDVSDRNVFLLRIAPISLSGLFTYGTIKNEKVSKTSKEY